jgi:uncharacterized protein YjeT (DUF2065 family)
MIALVASGVIVLTGLYFVWLGVTSVFAPVLAARFLSGFASSAFKHYLELFIRFAIGWSLLVRAPHMLFPEVLVVFGWVLVVTTVGLLVIPWQWHHRFAQLAVPPALRHLKIIGVVSVLLGTLVLAAVFRGVA